MGSHRYIHEQFGDSKIPYFPLFMKDSTLKCQFPRHSTKESVTQANLVTLFGFRKPRENTTINRVAEISDILIQNG